MIRYKDVWLIELKKNGKIYKEAKIEASNDCNGDGSKFNFTKEASKSLADDIHTEDR